MHQAWLLSSHIPNLTLANPVDSIFRVFRFFLLPSPSTISPWSKPSLFLSEWAQQPPNWLLVFTYGPCNLHHAARWPFKNYVKSYHSSSQNPLLTFNPTWQKTKSSDPKYLQFTLLHLHWLPSSHQTHPCFRLVFALKYSSSFSTLFEYFPP